MREQTAIAANTATNANATLCAHSRYDSIPSAAKMVAKKYQRTIANGANEITHPDNPSMRAKQVPTKAASSVVAEYITGLTTTFYCLWTGTVHQLGYRIKMANRTK
jgi:hypothetical protein